MPRGTPLHAVEAGRQSSRHFCVRWGKWMFQNGHLYREETRPTANGRYKVIDWFLIF